VAAARARSAAGLQRVHPRLLRITLRDGHLYGARIDILNHGSPLMLVALGMTLVIATGGVDLSVGAMVAIAGGGGGQAASGIITASSPPPRRHALALRRRWRAGARSERRCWWPGFGVQPIVATLILMVAGRGIAQLIVTGGQIINRPPGPGLPGQRPPVRPALHADPGGWSCSA
jgi:hypothetical protein